MPHIRDIYETNTIIQEGLCFVRVQHIEREVQS